MPPRLITGAILAFWLGMTGWLIEREVVPMMLADASPSYMPDLTDEIGAPIAGWTVLRGGNRIGSGTSKVERRQDRTYEFRSVFHFDDLAFGIIQVRKLENKYNVTETGSLLGLSTKVSVNLTGQDVAFELAGEVVDDFLEPHISALGIVQTLDKVPVRRQGSIVNPMNLVNRVSGLHEGRTWVIPMLDPFRGVTDKLLGGFAKGTAIPAVIAKVKAGTLEWDRKEVGCFIIEYSEPGKDVTARTWVRKLDGLVLQQEANHGGFDLVLQRIPN